MYRRAALQTGRLQGRNGTRDLRYTLTSHAEKRLVWMKPLLILKTGSTVEPLRPRGDFDDWFAAHSTQPVETIDCTSVDHYPSIEDYRGVIITGSPAMVSHCEPWSENAAAWLREIYADAPFLLGVCYGHQLIAHALGGTVGANPQGRQIGSTSVSLNELANEDVLLGALPSCFPAQVSHSEVVLEPPLDAVILGSTVADVNHVIRFRPNVWGVQFHPEFDADIVREYIQYRWEAIAQERLDPAGLQNGVVDSPQGPALLRSFDLLTRTAVAEAV